MNDHPLPMGENTLGDVVDASTFLCRCEEILDEEIIGAIVAGARTVDDIKRRTRAGMGLCQGIFCMPVIAAVVAQATGTPVDHMAPMTTRPPLRPIALEALADVRQRDEQIPSASTGETSD